MSEKNKIPKKVLWTRILCAFLAFLMVASVAYLSISSLIMESVRTAKAEKEAEAAKTAAGTTTKASNTAKTPSTTETPSSGSTPTT